MSRGKPLTGWARVSLFAHIMVIALLVLFSVTVGAASPLKEGVDTHPAKTSAAPPANAGSGHLVKETGAVTKSAAPTDHSTATEKQFPASRLDSGPATSIRALASSLHYYPLAMPIRLLDTRPNHIAYYMPGSPHSGGIVYQDVVAGITYNGVTIPATAAAVSGNATVVADAGGGPGFVTIFPSGPTLPTVSNLNYVPGQVAPNAFTVGLNSGSFNLYQSTTVDQVIDLTGYWAPPGAGGLFFHPLSAPIRLLDTRPGSPAFIMPGTPDVAGTIYSTTVAGISYNGITIPANATAVVGNATAVNNLTNSPAGFVTLFPKATTVPLASNLNYVPGQVVPNAFTVGLGSGAFSFFQTTTIDFVIDLAGYFSTSASDANGPGLAFNPLSSPLRLLDTRPGYGACLGGAGPHVGDTAYIDPVGGSINGAPFVCAGLSIPSTAAAVLGNATVVADAGGGPGFVTLYPGNVSLPLASNLNYVPGQVVPNAFIVGVGGAIAGNGTVYTTAFRIYQSTTVDEVIDLYGYFA